ncbi:unnamed protein product [Clonostachys chloroleuca]|uniref:Uncharacterized protein n=1 Tax=Clonostachys chloroleuca TaxID=1926264 RepID=A0AA35Q4D9_9HYPO|nr:unnamed protein product [Clonostachys chloroleuca]
MASISTRAPGDPVAANLTREQAIVEAWAQGFSVGSVVILILFVLCNYRRKILLHKLILLELFLAGWHGIFIFFDDPAYGWVLSSTAALLYISYNLHNVISWLKIKPFLPRWGGHLFIISLLLVQPYWVLETWANFQYFNILGNNLFKHSRYFEPLARDPWWIFTTVKLVMVINKNYGYTLIGLVKTSPRFGIMLLCMFLSIVFLATDVAVTATISTQSGINPFWRLALVFKCASDAIFLDDFKSVLDHIADSALRRINLWRPIWLRPSPSIESPPPWRHSTSPLELECRTGSHNHCRQKTRKRFGVSVDGPPKQKQRKIVARKLDH